MSSFQAQLAEVRAAHRQRREGIDSNGNSVTSAAPPSIAPNSPVTKKRPHSTTTPPYLQSSADDSDSDIEVWDAPCSKPKPIPKPTTSSSKPSSSSSSSSSVSSSSSCSSLLSYTPSPFTVLSYNAWFDPSNVEQRMSAISSLCSSPPISADVVLLQELTRDLEQHLAPRLEASGYTLLRQAAAAPYWVGVAVKTKDAHLTVTHTGTKEFTHTRMGRGLVYAVLKRKADFTSQNLVLVCTAHLESFVGEDAKEESARCRASQLREAQLFCRALRGKHPAIKHVVFGGDCNWDDALAKGSKRKLPDVNMAELARSQHQGVGLDWRDVYLEQVEKAGGGLTSRMGYTYDPKENPMLNSKSSLRRRFDRIFVDRSTGTGTEVTHVEVVKPPVIPGLTFRRLNQFTGTYGAEMPVTPSDHFPLLARFNI